MMKTSSSTRIFSALFCISLPIYLGTLACEVNTCESDDCFSDGFEDDEDEDDDDQSAGGSGGTASLGASGAGNNAGTDEAEELESVTLDCHEDGLVSGEPGDTSPTVEMSDDDYECQACAERLCAPQLTNCYATGPDSVCLSGTTILDEDGEGLGEANCMLSCFLDLEDDLTLSEIDVEECAAQCGSTECESGVASSVTQDLMRCFLDTTETDPAELGCVTECGLDIYL